MYKHLLLIFIASLAALALDAQVQHPSTLIRNCVVHTATGEVYEEGALGIRDGMIDYVGRNVAAPKNGYDQVLDFAGRHIYPALISTNTTLGINEISAVRATRDYNEIGKMNPNVRSISAYNAESDVTATVLSNGVLFAQVVPRGGVLSGTSSVVVLKAWNWEDASYRSDEGLHLHWPRMYKHTGEEEADPEAYIANEDYEKELRHITEFFTQAQAYAKRDVPVERDLRFESMRGVFNGSKRLYVHCDFIKEIREVSLFKNDYGVAKVSIVGGYDSWMAADLLREAGISVLVKRVNSLPRFAEDAVDAAYSLPAKLAEAGVTFCLEMDGDMETMQNRNLPFNAGTAIGYGLSRDKALEAITIEPARILGIDHRTGSLEVGKEANFIVSVGDIFDMRFSKVMEVYHLGQSLDLENRQDELYKKYANKLKLEQK